MADLCRGMLFNVNVIVIDDGINLLAIKLQHIKTA